MTPTWSPSALAHWPAQLTTTSASMSPASVRTPVTRRPRDVSVVSTPSTRTRSCTRTPWLRAPFASASVRSVGLARPSCGSQIAPSRSSIAMTGHLSCAWLRRQHLAVQVEGRGGRDGTPQRDHPLLGPGHDQAAALAVSRRQPGLGLQPGVQLGGVLHQPGAALAGPQQPDQAGGVPGGAARQRALLEQHHVGPAELGQVVRRGAADHAAADDDDLRAWRGGAVHRAPPPCRATRRSRRP